MKQGYNFSKAKRSAVILATGKTRIASHVDGKVLKHFKTQAKQTGKGCQMLIDEALQLHSGITEQQETLEFVCKILRVAHAVHGRHANG